MCLEQASCSDGKPARPFWQRTSTKLPVLGPVLHQLDLARFARTAAALVRYGVPLVEVLRTSARAVSSPPIETAVLAAAIDVERGQTIAAALGKHPVFPKLIIRMFVAGGQTGTVQGMLERLADFLEEEVETTLGSVIPLAEALLVLILAVAVSTIVMCALWPVFQLTEMFSGSLQFPGSCDLPNIRIHRWHARSADSASRPRGGVVSPRYQFVRSSPDLAPCMARGCEVGREV